MCTLVTLHMSLQLSHIVLLAFFFLTEPHFPLKAIEQMRGKKEKEEGVSSHNNLVSTLTQTGFYSYDNWSHMLFFFKRYQYQPYIVLSNYGYNLLSFCNTHLYIYCTIV